MVFNFRIYQINMVIAITSAISNIKLFVFRTFVISSPRVIIPTTMVVNNGDRSNIDKSPRFYGDKS